MSTHKHFDKICCVVLAVTLILAVLSMNAEHFGVQKASAVMGYENTLFDPSKVHTINIIMDDWNEFLENCKNEEYYECTVIIDNKAFKNVAIRGKGNTSLTQVEAYGNERYSYKIEFNHYDNTNTYYGLDKLCLNNIIQDNTYMKDYLTYQMMNDMGVASPLCSYANITVNGEDWGLYLAVEGVEESFLKRNYGNDYGELYKPDSMSMGMGGGRGNGEEFDMDEFLKDFDKEDIDQFKKEFNAENTNRENKFHESSNNTSSQTFPQMPGSSTEDNSEINNQIAEKMQEGNNQGSMQDKHMPGNMPGGGMRNSSDDVLLKYIDDTYESYSNIFNHAKTNSSDSDKARFIQALKKLSNGEELADTVDIETVIRYFVVHNFVLNFDSYTGSMIHNYYLYEENGQLQMIPWDYNLAFGGFQSMGSATSLVNYPIDSPVFGGAVKDRPMIAWIFENEEYTELYHQYFSEFISEYFDSGYFEQSIDNVISMISPYVEKDPTKFCTYEEFKTGVSTLKEFCLLRAKSISGQLSGTIGSTSDTQESDTLIDAGNLQVNDMGSMNNAMGGGGPNNPNNNVQNLQGEADKNQSTNGSPSQMPDGQMPGKTPPDVENSADRTNSQDVFGGRMNRPNDNTKMPDWGQTKQPRQSSNSIVMWIWLVISVGILVFGLLFARLFKRRRLKMNRGSRS